MSESDSQALTLVTFECYKTHVAGVSKESTLLLKIINCFTLVVRQLLDSKRVSCKTCCDIVYQTWLFH